MLKGHPLSQISSDGGALVGMCGRHEDLGLSMVAH
jgi:hypothetical protein